MWGPGFVKAGCHPFLGKAHNFTYAYSGCILSPDTSESRDTWQGIIQLNSPTFVISKTERLANKKMTLVPTVNAISFYSDVDSQIARYKAVKLKFLQTYGEDATLIARAPGRVNLIGEHIDYCHFSVLPMAIEVDVIAPFAPSGNSTVTITNTDPKFSKERFDIPQDGSLVEIDKSNPTWGDYFKCAIIVAQNYIIESHPQLWVDKKKRLRGLNALFDGTVPTGGGLSSSAAFCICATLAILYVNGVTEISKEDLTKITVVSEHYVGLNNGGMDQCASINGEPNKALLVLFKPELKSRPFGLPSTDPETIFLVTNSLITANKTETAPTNYNLRVVEVAVAADLLARKFNLKVPQDSNLETASLRGSFDAYYTQKLQQASWDGLNIDLGIERLSKMLELIENVYPGTQKEGLTSEEAARAVGLTLEQFHAKYLSRFPVHYEKLNLYRRSKHVYSDALRVLQTISIAKKFDGDSHKFLNEFGKLLNESQVSTKELNQASASGCDELCDLGVSNGAYGSRVTGAGFGGSIVHMTTVDRLPGLVEAITEKYYKKHFPDISKESLSSAIVVSKPSQGACLVDFRYM